MQIAIESRVKDCIATNPHQQYQCYFGNGQIDHALVYIRIMHGKDVPVIVASCY